MLNPTIDFPTWVAAQQTRLETALEAALPGAEIAPEQLHTAMRYAALGGGKRVRALLSFAAGEATRADPATVSQVAASIEFIHAYSLVHDDLPCMDNDELRRGKPACHIEFDEATALLVGDSLQALAYALLADMKMLDCTRQLEMLKLLAVAAGSRGMAGGQAIDLTSVGKTLSVPELEFMHIHKTGALIRAAVMLGAMCGESNEQTLQGLDHYAKSIGLAFQIIDDVLDVESPTAILGKTARKDVDANKPTYVTAVGVAQAKEMASELYEGALASLVPLGDDTGRLAQIAKFIVHRTF